MHKRLECPLALDPNSMDPVLKAKKALFDLALNLVSSFGLI